MDNNVNVHEGHRKRMRDRFLATGFDGFEEHQILEMLLFYACPRIDTNELAHNLIRRFGSLSGVMDASVKDITSVQGISVNAAVLLKMIPKCMMVYYSSHTEKMSFDDTTKLKNLFSSCYLGVTNEEFRVACFDNDLRLISNTVVSKGTPSFTPVNMRKITEIVISSQSSYIALGHNHPSGSPAPSNDDIFTTRRIKSTLSTMGVTVLDHIIVGSNSTVSMREKAILNIFD